MNKKEVTIERIVEKQEEGLYFPVKFQVPAHVEEMEIAYEYERYSTEENDREETVKKEKNIIDLAVCGTGNHYVGSSGSNRNKIHLSSYGSSQGFAALEIVPGEWQIILGAYKVEEKGCKVVYRITFYQKERKIYRGDTHIHTIGSDGNCNLEEIAGQAKKAGLDYVFITDHNNYSHNDHLPAVKGLTMIPGAEWTHYKGHAGMLGVNRPFDSPFCVNTEAEMKEKLCQAGTRGAKIVLNHPFCQNCGWKWGIERTQYDMIEIWNGSTFPEANRKCLEWWDGQLREGRKIPVIGGSDYHRTEYGRMIASPCTCVYAESRTGSDILKAMTQGNSFLVYHPDGPTADCESGGYFFGEGTEIKLHFRKLRANDRILLITDRNTEELAVGDGVSELRCSRAVRNVKYLRAEIWREPVPGEQMPALLTNPFYADGAFSAGRM